MVFDFYQGVPKSECLLIEIHVLNILAHLTLPQNPSESNCYSHFMDNKLRLSEDMDNA